MLDSRRYLVIAVFSGKTFPLYDDRQERSSLSRIHSGKCYVKIGLGYVRNHVKLEIRSFVMNFNSRGFSLRVLYCVVDTGYGLGRSLGDCRPALPEGQKYQMVKQTKSHDRRPIV